MERRPATGSPAARPAGGRRRSRNGLGKLVDSWVGTGQNLPASPSQIPQALGPKVQELAQQHGMSTDAVSQALSQLLPGLVDHLTPNGPPPGASSSPSSSRS